MKPIIRIIACLGNSILFLIIVATIRGALGSNINPLLSLFLLIFTLVDLTYVNYRIWKAI